MEMFEHEADLDAYGATPLERLSAEVSISLRLLSAAMVASGGGA
jgi:hypothetical protein